MKEAEMNIRLRREREDETRAVEELTREAFWNVYAPGCSEHYLLHGMRRSAAFIPELNMVAERDGRLVGHIAYARTAIALDAGDECPVITFGPVSVLPAYQQTGIGSALIETTKEMAREMGFSAILILGDPAYYHRFGFVPAEVYGIRNAEGRYADALQALELQPGALAGATGCFCEGEAYAMDESGFEAFERSFSPMEKGYAPTQDRFLELQRQVHDG